VQCGNARERLARIVHNWPVLHRLCRAANDALSWNRQRTAANNTHLIEFAAVATVLLADYRIMSSECVQG